MILSIIELLCWSIRHIFRERRLLHEVLDVITRIAANATCEINILKVVWMRETIESLFALFPRVDAHHIEHFFQPFEYTVGDSEVADVCRCTVPGKLDDSSYTQHVLGTPVCKSILHLARRWLPSLHFTIEDLEITATNSLTF